MVTVINARGETVYSCYNYKEAVNMKRIYDSIESKVGPHKVVAIILG